MLIPTPGPAKVTAVSERLRSAFNRRLHPTGAIQRTLDIEITSWIGGCMVRSVGDLPAEAEDERGGSGMTTEVTTLGSAAEPLHEWLLNRGLTLSPAQSTWVSQLRQRGWQITAVLVTPRAESGPPPPVLKGPVIAVTHLAEEPILAVGHPPFALMDEGDTPPALELAVLTEWAVSPAAVDEERLELIEPFYADAMLGRDLSQLGTEAGALPWAYKRDGTLTAFHLTRPPGLGLLKLVKAEPRPPIRPTPAPRLRNHRFKLPIELLMLLLALGGWTWLRYGRRDKRDKRLR